MLQYMGMYDNLCDMSTEVKDTYSEAKESLVIYEVGYLLLPTLPEEKLEGVIAKLKAVLADKKAIIIDEEAPKMRALAYIMDKIIETKRQKFDHAYFGWIKFEVEASEIASIKKNIEVIDEILRCLFVKTIRENTLISQKIQPKEEEIKIEGVAPEIVAEVLEVKADTEDIDKSIDALVMN